MKSILPAAAVGLGILLLSVSVAWSVLFPPSRSWTPEKAARLTQIGNQCSQIKLKLHMPKPSNKPGETPAELKAEFEKLDAQYKELYQQFVSATDAPKTAKGVLWWSGIACVVAGGIVVFASRS